MNQGGYYHSATVIPSDRKERSDSATVIPSDRKERSD